MSWFQAYAATTPDDITAAESNAIERYAPPKEFPALLDIGCGIGRNAAALASRGYRVTGIDINADAIAHAQHTIRDAKFFVLDQRHIDRLAQTFDVAIVLWNSIGFGTRDEDVAILKSVGRSLRTGGRLLIDMYNPAWLARHEQRSVRDERGTIVNRQLRSGRSVHCIAYADGTTDDIEFNVYAADELTAMLRLAGFTAGPPLVWWNDNVALTTDAARYQLVCVNTEKSGAQPEYLPGVQP